MPLVAATHNHNIDNSVADNRTANFSTSYKTTNAQTYSTSLTNRDERRFNNVNTYYHTTHKSSTDMSLLLITLGINIAVPIVNELISKAINKWNDEIPNVYSQQAQEEYDLLLFKTNNVVSKFHSDEIPRHDNLVVTANDFLNMQIDFNSKLANHVQNATIDMVIAACENDNVKFERGEKELEKVTNCFKTSISSRLQLPNRNFSKISNALMTLDRLNPTNHFCDESTILIRHMNDITHVNVSEYEFREMNSNLAFCNLYDIQHKKFQGKYTLTMTPKVDKVTSMELSMVYGRNFHSMTVFEVFTQMNPPWYVSMDSNFKMTNIVQNMYGHSLAILDEVLNDLHRFIINSMLIRENSRYAHVYDQATHGPWSSGIETFNFSDPFCTFVVKGPRSLINVTKDFKNLKSLISLMDMINNTFPMPLVLTEQLMDYINAKKIVCNGLSADHLSPTAPEPQNTIMEKPAAQISRPASVATAQNPTCIERMVQEVLGIDIGPINCISDIPRFVLTELSQQDQSARVIIELSGTHPIFDSENNHIELVRSTDVTPSQESNYKVEIIPFSKLFSKKKREFKECALYLFFKPRCVSEKTIANLDDVIKSSGCLPSVIELVFDIDIGRHTTKLSDDKELLLKIDEKIRKNDCLKTGISFEINYGNSRLNHVSIMKDFSSSYCEIENPLGTKIMILSTDINSWRQVIFDWGRTDFYADLSTSNFKPDWFTYKREDRDVLLEIHDLSQMPATSKFHPNCLTHTLHDVIKTTESIENLTIKYGLMNLCTKNNFNSDQIIWFFDQVRKFDRSKGGKRISKLHGMVKSNGSSSVIVYILETRSKSGGLKRSMDVMVGFEDITERSYIKPWTNLSRNGIKQLLAIDIDPFSLMCEMKEAMFNFDRSV